MKSLEKAVETASVIAIRARMANADIPILCSDECELETISARAIVIEAERKSLLSSSANGAAPVWQLSVSVSAVNLLDPANVAANDAVFAEIERAIVHPAPATVSAIIDEVGRDLAQLEFLPGQNSVKGRESELAFCRRSFECIASPYALSYPSLPLPNTPLEVGVFENGSLWPRAFGEASPMFNRFEAVLVVSAAANSEGDSTLIIERANGEKWSVLIEGMAAIPDGLEAGEIGAVEQTSAESYVFGRAGNKLWSAGISGSGSVISSAERIEIDSF